MAAPTADPPNEHRVRLPTSPPKGSQPARTRQSQATTPANEVNSMTTSAVAIATKRAPGGIKTYKEVKTVRETATFREITTFREIKPSRRTGISSKTETRTETKT